MSYPQSFFRIWKDPNLLQTTGYMEIGPGKYSGLHWQSGFLFIGDYEFVVAEGIIRKHFEDYSHIEMNDLPRPSVLSIINDWRQIAKKLPALCNDDIEQELNLREYCPQYVAEHVANQKDEVAHFLDSLATECETLLGDSGWICILGM